MLPRIRELYPDARVVVLYRDGRDVASSLTRVPWMSPNLYVNFLQKSFAERSLQPSNLTIHVAGNAAWAVFDWTFTAKLANGQPFTSKGWESHGYQRTNGVWRIVHLHYSVPPPPPPP